MVCVPSKIRMERYDVCVNFECCFWKWLGTEHLPAASSEAEAATECRPTTPPRPQPTTTRAVNPTPPPPTELTGPGSRAPPHHTAPGQGRRVSSNKAGTGSSSSRLHIYYTHTSSLHHLFGRKGQEWNHRTTTARRIKRTHAESSSDLPSLFLFMIKESIVN